jgi:hypothetical protein
VTSHVVVLPLTKETNNEISSELACKNLSEEVNVGDKGGLQNDWDV